MKKFSRKKKWIIFLAVFLCVIVSGVTVFFACSGGGAAQPFEEQPSESMSYRLDPPDDGSLPEDHTQLENLGYIVGRLMARGYYHTDSSSEVSANALGVTVNQYVEGGKNYKDGVLIASTFSRGEGLGAPSPVAMQKFFGADKAVIRSAVSSDPADWNGGETEWDAGEPSEILSREQYSSRYGLWGTEFSDYVMQEDTILSFEEIVREGEEYVLSFSLDPVESTHYYGNQMITMGGLSACPAFEYVNVTLRYTEDWSITEMRISEKYTSSKGIIKAETTGETVISYSYDEADADVSDYEEYFVRYAQADETGPTETERTASDYLAEGFGSVLVSDRTAFAIEAKIGEKTVSGTALLHMSGADAGTMQFAVGALNVLIDINGGEVFLSYKDFNGRLAFADAMALLGVSGGFSLDSLMPALEEAIAGGTVSKGEGSAEVSVVLPLGDMSVPLGFGFSETDAGVSWSYIDAALSLAGTQISLHVTPAPADTELAPVDTEGAVDLFPYIEDILGLVQGKAFSLTVNYAGDGFALAGDVVVDTASGAASGEVLLTAGGVSVPVGFTYAGGEVWLSAGGAKVRAQAGEWLDALLPMLGISFEMPDTDIAALLGALVGADYDAIFKGLSLTEGQLSLAIDGDALLAAFAPDAGVSLGDITAVYDREKGSFSVKVLGAELTLAGTEEEVSLPADADSYVLLRPDDVLPFIEPIAALSSAKDIAFEGYAETEIEGLKLTLGITGEVWFADPEAVRVYLGLVVNGTEEIEIYYADGKVTLACGAYGMEIAESELKALAEKFSSLFAAEEGMPVSALLLSSDGLDLAALLDGIKLLGANENGIQFAADLSALLEGMNVTARIGAAENGLTLTEGGLTVAGIALNNVSAQVYAADNAFTPDFSGVEMKEDLVAFLLNVLFGSDRFAVGFSYNGNGFALAGEVVVDVPGAGAAGTVQITASGVSVPVGFVLKNGEVWLSAGGAKVRAQAGEWLDALLPMLGISLPEAESGLSDLFGGLVGADFGSIFKQFSLTAEGQLSLVIDGNALLAAFAPDAGVSLGDITAVYDREKGSFSVKVLGAELTLAGTEEEVGLPADAESYVLLRPDDVLPFIEPIAALSSAKDIAFEGYAETEIEGVKLTLGITGEVWFADPEAVRVYLGLVVNGTEEIEIYYADGKVTLACGAYGMEVAESELKSLAEKFSSLFAAEEGMPVSALLLSSDGLDLAALLDGIKLLGANENGIQFAADLSALLDGMNVTARIGAAENGLTLTEGGLTVAGIALNNVSAQVYAAENAFTPDFSGVEMKEDLVAFLLNVLFGSDRFAVGFTYNGNGFALAGEVVVDVPGAGAAGTVQITASGVSVPVGFVLKNGEVWLSAGGAKVRAQAGEWLDALLPMLGISLPEAESGLSDLFGGLVGADFGSIFKQFTLADGKLSLVIDGDALLAAFAPDAGVSLGDITAVYDREKGSFSVKVLGAELTLSGTEEEVSLPADADSYVLLRPDDVLPFIEPIAALSSAKDIAFEGYAETEIEGLKLTLGITGEVWFADPEAVRVYLGLVVNGTEEIEIYYADGKVTLAYGAYGMEVAESELKSLAEKFSSLFAAEEGMPVSALLLSSDGLDLAALLDGIKLLGANENGIQFAADLSALLDGMNVTARIGAAENGLTLTEGGLTVAGVALNNVSAQVYAADNAFTPDFSGVTMCDDVFELLLNAYIQFADSEFLTLSFDYEDESMKADMTAALRLKRTEENIVFELAAEAVISAGGSNYYMQVSVVDTYAYIYFSLIGFEDSVYYPEAVAEGVSPLRAKIAVSSLFDMSSEAMPLIVSLMGLNKNELYYFNFVVELLGGTYETINSDIFGTKTAEEWADLIIGIIKEYTGDTRAQDVSSGNISVSFDAENLALILSGSGMNVVLSAGGEREIKAPSDGYTDYSSLAGLVKVLMGSITQSETTEDAEGNPVESAEINSYYYLSGVVTGSLGSIDLTSIGVAASVYVGDDFGVTANVRLDVSYFVGVFKGDTVLEMTIEDGMVYMVRTQTTAADSVFGLVEVNLDEPIVLYRVTTLDNFFGDILSHLGFLFNFSDSINEQIAGAGSGGSGKSAVTDIGGILTSYEAGQTESGMPQWSFGLDLSSLTDGVLASSTLSLYADAENVLQGMSFTATMPVTSVISLKLTADLTYNNPGESMESGHDADITANVAENVRSLFDKALEETDWSQTSYIEGRTATLTYVAEGQTLMTQTVAYDTSTGALLSYTDLPDLSSFNGEGYTYSWGSIGAISGNTTIDAVKTPNEYTVTIRSEYEIDGLECVRTEGGYFVYELTYTYGTRLDLPVGTEYAKTYELAAFEGEDGSVSSVENITSDVVLTAVWEEIEYTVTYTVLGEVYTTQTYGYGEALVLPEASAEGFAFEGWDTDALTVESDMTVEAILSATVTLGSDFAAEGFAQGEGGWYRSYSLQGTAEEDFAFDLQLSCAGYAQFGWWCEGNGWQYVSSLAGLDGKTVWTAWVSEVKVEVTEAKKSWGLWTINGRYTGGAFSGAVSEQIAASAGISCSAQAWLKLSKDGVNDFDTLNSGNSVGVAADGSFGKGSMTSASDLFGGAKYGGAKVAVTYTYGELSLTLEGVAWKEK